MEPIAIKKADVDKDPYIIWNTFVNILSNVNIGEMSDLQKKAALCFRYDSEMQSGGHLLYFENTLLKGETDYIAVIKALAWLGAPCQAEILFKAVTLRMRETRGKIKDAEDFVSRIKEEMYATLDTDYYDCEPDIDDLLENLLGEHQDEFIIVETFLH